MATFGTTCTLPPSSVAHCGEWNLGNYFDVYRLSAKSGDQCCEQILSGLDPRASIFETLPLHFTVGIENELVNDAIHRYFPSIKNTA